MSTTLLVPPNTYDVSDLIHAGFATVPADASWINCRYQHYHVNHGLDRAETLTFKVPPVDNHTMIWTKQMYMVATVRICDRSREDLPDGAEVRILSILGTE